jgi:DNA-binding GntR family transcriptional regulator
MILEMKISPNECISESKLASMIGMSRTPIREALTRLKNEAILISSDKKGYFLNIPTIKEIKDLYEVRTIMECGAIRLAAPKIDLHKLEYFEKQFLCYKNESSGTDDKDFNFVKLGRAFHFFIIESAENKLVREFINGIYERLEISRLYSYDKRRDDAVDEHLEIVGSLKERNPEKCQKYMEEHLKKAFNMLIKIL